MENEEKKQPACNEMRKAWFEFVRKTRTKLSRGQKDKCSHRDAMKAASEGWVKEKQKVAKRLARAKKKAVKI